MTRHEAAAALLAERARIWANVTGGMGRCPSTSRSANSPTTGASDMTIPEQLRALASFIEEHGLTDADILSAGISYEGGRVLLRIAPFRVLTTGLCVTVRITRSREGHIHHAAETASGGMAITLAACTPSDEVPR